MTSIPPSQYSNHTARKYNGSYTADYLRRELRCKVDDMIAVHYLHRNIPSDAKGAQDCRDWVCAAKVEEYPPAWKLVCWRSRSRVHERGRPSYPVRFRVERLSYTVGRDHHLRAGTAIPRPSPTYHGKRGRLSAGPSLGSHPSLAWERSF
jgi:hypothetical protein